MMCMTEPTKLKNFIEPVLGHVHTALSHTDFGSSRQFLLRSNSVCTGGIHCSVEDNMITLSLCYHVGVHRDTATHRDMCDI